MCCDFWLILALEFNLAGLHLLTNRSTVLQQEVHGVENVHSSTFNVESMVGVDLFFNPWVGG